MCNVLDLFGGSGYAFIAREQADRKAFLMEMDPLYCDLICQRFVQFSGKQVIRERDGEEMVTAQSLAVSICMSIPPMWPRRTVKADKCRVIGMDMLPC